MTTSFVCYIVLVWTVASSGSAASPGLQIRLSQPGLNYAAGVAVDVLAKSVLQLKIPDQHGSTDIKVGKVSYDVTNIRVTNFIKPGTTVSINPDQGLTWRLSNAGVSVHGNWHYKYRLLFIVIQDSGSFDGDVSGASLTESITLGQDPTGHPTIASTGCQCNINSVSIRLHGGASWLYNLFIGNVEGPLRNSLQSQICTAAQNAINQNARQQLATLPIEFTIDNKWLFDYRLTSPPAFKAGFVDSFHKGEFFFKGETAEAPFQADAFPVTAGDQMLTILVSDYILKTMGYVLYKHDILKYNLTKNDLPPDERGFLNTTCTSVACFGFLIPQAGKAFPNASAELEMFASSYPTATISSTDIQGNFAGIIAYRARLSNGSLVPMFRTKVSAVVNLDVTLNNMVLRGNLTKLTPTIQVVETQIGPIPDFILNGVFNLAAKLFIIPGLNAIGQKGIPIPSIKDVQFSNTKLEKDNHCLRISTDVRYSPSTTALHFLPREP
jgi:lipopolysaccharide-binding protein